MLRALLFGLLLVAPVAAAEQDPDLKQLQGRWEVVELSEDGHVIPQEAISEWLPSGGKLEISENAILVASPQDGKKTAKVFSIDATQYPKGIDIFTRDKKEAVGIYRFDEGRLVVCLSDPEEGSRPQEFSARQDSKRILMVLKRVAAESKERTPEAAVVKPVATPDSKAGIKLLSDAEIRKLLIGSWRLKDEAGALIVSLSENGTWSTIRESTQMRLLTRVFVQTAISSGTWSVDKGVLTFHCSWSIHADRVNRALPFTVRSISASDFIFVDSMGRLGRAGKVK